MNPHDLDGRSVAVLLMGKNDEGEDDWAVFGGTARADAEGLRVERPGDEPPFRVAAEWVDRIRPTTPEQREILLGAEFVLPLPVGPLPDDADPNDYLATGLRWPE